MKPPDTNTQEGGKGQTRSFAAVASSQRPRPRFQPIRLPPRQPGLKDGKPAVSFTSTEIQAGAKRFDFSLVAKFTIGKPSLSEIQRAFQSNWNLTGRATISEIWDSRHVLIILDSEEDVTAALSCPLRKINHSMFRLFRWNIDYNPKKESTTTTAWVRLPGLPLPLYDRAYISAILSSFSNFLDVDDRTKACLSMKFARACIEIDVTQPIPDKIWINMGGEGGYWQDIEMETKLSYCSKCRVHGHELANCRKVAQSADKTTLPKNKNKIDYGPDNLCVVTTEQVPTGEGNSKKQEWIKVQKKKTHNNVNHVVVDNNNKGTPTLQPLNAIEEVAPVPDINSSSDINPTELVQGPIILIDEDVQNPSQAYTHNSYVTLETYKTMIAKTQKDTTALTTEHDITINKISDTNTTSPPPHEDTADHTTPLNPQ